MKTRISKGKKISSNTGPNTSDNEREDETDKHEEGDVEDEAGRKKAHRYEVGAGIIYAYIRDNTRGNK